MVIRNTRLNVKYLFYIKKILIYLENKLKIEKDIKFFKSNKGEKYTLTALMTYFPCAELEYTAFGKKI